jgi:beta-mannosidase
MEAYASGLVQAYAIEIAIRAQRLSKPKSYGTLYWQFNDAWPSISWSSIDYYGRWKPLQYAAKRLYKDIILFYNPKTKKVAAINDKLYAVNGSYSIVAMTFDGKVLFKSEETISLKPNEHQ